MVGVIRANPPVACAASRAEGRAIIVMKHVRQNRQGVSSRSTKTRATQLLAGAEIGLDASHTTSSSPRGTGGVFFLDILSHRTGSYGVVPLVPHVDSDQSSAPG